MAVARRLQDFDRAMRRVSQAGKKPHLLLGNGFSRACRDDIFAYGALFERADFKKCSKKARQAFEALKTSDFEVVMRALRDTATLLQLYGGDVHERLRTRLLEDAEALREVLVHAIADSHPSQPGDISPESYGRCRAFLERFADVYTLNYDLLLYWAIMQEELLPEVSLDDGFRTPDAGPSEYVTWEVEKTDKQSVFYLHGALHIFDAGHEVQKYTWVNTGIRLIDQIRSALEQGLYPLFVAEGDSARKLARIKHSDFLARSYRSFAKIAGTLVVFGHSFADNDAHILQRIRRGRIAQLLVGVHGDPESTANKRLIREAKGLANGRPDKHPLMVEFFDSASVEVW
jgi:hypothetical protein